MSHYDPVVNLVKNVIKENGSISIAQYMDIVLAAPDHGYYMRQDPFGLQGDFTTAPEISQIFGEIIGAWLVDTWDKMGQPEQIALVECGAGRGTLMSDVLRTLSQFKPAIAAFKPYCLDISPALVQVQKNTLKKWPMVSWVNDLDGVPDDMPMIIIGNELLDALPIDQVVRTKGGFFERRIVCDGQNFAFELMPCRNDLKKRAKPYEQRIKQNEILELAPAAECFMSKVIQRLQKLGGAGLFVDYGHAYHGAGDSLQALHKHKSCDIFENIGNADLTAHVNFEAIATQLSQGKKHYFSAVKEQGAFLSALGGQYRAQYLAEKAVTETQKKSILNGYSRLREDDQMGQLFKVLGFVYGYQFTPAGF